MTDPDTYDDECPNVDHPAIEALCAAVDECFGCIANDEITPFDMAYILLLAAQSCGTFAANVKLLAALDEDEDEEEVKFDA